MGVSFEDYCEEFFDMDVALMSEQELSQSKKNYAAFIKKAKAADEKHQKALAKAKESRKLAKFYGGKALKGSAKQKSWAEGIRNTVLESSALTEQEKKELVLLGDFTDDAKFWISNKDCSPASFAPSKILDIKAKLQALYDTHYETLARTGEVYAIECARKEVYEALKNLPLKIEFSFPKCDFYDAFGNLKADLQFRC